MKKIILMTFVLSSLMCFSQSYDLKSVKEAKFFGIDYSNVKVFGAQESPLHFQTSFYRINDLFITEAPKYDVSKYIKKNIYAISLDEVFSQIEKMDLGQLSTTDKRYASWDIDKTKEALNALPIAPEEGLGVIFIAKMLDKSVDTGYYQVVFFNMETKEIFYSIPVAGKAGGFGLRNFWAGSIYKIIKSGRITYF